MNALHHSSITHKIFTLIAIAFALFMATACGNIAGTNAMNQNVQKPKAPQNTVQATSQQNLKANNHSTVNPTNFGGVEPDIIVDRPN